MSTQVSSITLRAKYEGDLRGINDDIAKLKSIGRNLSANNPFKIRAQLDFSRIAKDAAEAGKMAATSFTKSFQSAMAGGLTPGSAVSKGGIIIPASAVSEVQKFAQASSGAFKQVATDGDKVIKTYEQLERGVQRVTTATKKGNKRTETITDTRPLENFKKSLADIERAYAGKIGAARGSKGDVASILAEKQKAINDVLSGANLNSLQGNERKRAQAQLRSIKDTPTFQKAEKSLDRLEERIQSTRGNQDRAGAKQSRGLRIDALKDSLLGIDTATAGAIGSAKGNKGDVAALLADKRRLIQAELAKFSDIADSPAYKSAQKAINNLDKGVAQAVPNQQNRATNKTRQQASQQADRFIKDYDRDNQEKVKLNKIEESGTRLIDNRAVRESEVNRILNAREKILQDQIAAYRQLEAAARQLGNAGAADKYRTAGNRVNNDLGQVQLDRRRERDLAAQGDSMANLNRRLQTIVLTNNALRHHLKLEEQIALKNTNVPARNAALNDIRARRGQLLNDTRGKLSGIEQEAADRGLHGVRASARSHIGKLDNTGTADMGRLAAATNKSGHAFNFHSNALLKNAATFTKWYVPAQLAMKTFAAFGTGLQGAIDAQRTFKILGATFRGTTEDAKLLADQTLMLAAANGRGVDEAAQAAVAWSRMGLTRNQILVATETSLRAANVAEISAAEATSYLTANYKAFGQTIADIPATLDYINSLSNKNAVAPKEIFQGLARSASIAKSAGIEFETLASIIATVSEVTQRPGAESGNAVKTILSRLNRPKVTADLKDQFGLDFSTVGGDVQNATQMLTKLAAVYPTLNTFEQGRLKNIVAGANQGNRFAIIMEHWTETLIAQAKAGLDANSAMRENANILDSVSAKLASMETSWTRLFHTLGEAGAFQAITDELNGLSIILGKVGDGINYLNSASSGSGKRTGVVSKIAGFATDSFGKLLEYGNLPGLIAGIGSDDRKNKPTSVSTDRLSKLAQESVQSRNKVKSLNAGDQAFQVMASQFGTKGVPNKTIIEQFDKAVEVLAALPGGQANVASARLRIRPLLEKGDVEGGRRRLSQTAAELYIAKEEEFKTSEAKRAESLKITEDAVAATTRESKRLNTEMANTQPGKAQDDLARKIYETDQALKEQQNSLATLQQKFEKPLPEPLAAHKDTLDAYLADLTAIGEVYGQLMTTFGSTGFADLDSKLKLGGARLNGDLLEQTVRKTEAENAAFDTSGADPAGKEKRDLMLGVLQDRLTDLRTATAEAERKIELERQAASLNTAYTDSRTSTGSGFSRYEIGRSEGGRLSSRTGGILGELQADVTNPNLGAGDATQDAQELGALTERLTQSKQGLASMEDRMNRALAERVNLEGDIAEASRKQTEELSKRLTLASREDQLRAAGAAAFLRNSGKGQFSQQQFQFFSQETRGAISNLSPNSVQGLDDTEKNNAEARGKLDREISGLAGSISSFRKIFDDLRPKAEEKGGGLIDPKNPFDSKGTTANQLLNSGKDEIRLNLNTGPININLDFSKHVQTIIDNLQGRFDQQAKATLESVKRMLGSGAGPNTAPAAGAW